ncbi:trace amine-associated receptor 13c-like [Thalassophryne amazonica]|uniref:trace amine-associated receptor 13c-like n=1 Tax=Thalassophryne amazonica TaxID=390379 RepID=UPI001470BA67|nr:trace amine-associated receptor 13c-like [Thalassophryne amazonica]
MEQSSAFHNFSTPSGSEAVLLPILMSSVSVLTVTLNLLVIISVSHFRQLHFPSNLLLSLAVSDVLVGLVVLPGDILQHSDCWFFGDLMCSVYNFVSLIIICASVGDMVLISVDRYIAVCHPLQYSARVTVRRTSLCICLCWFYSLFYTSLVTKAELSQHDSYHSCRGQCFIPFNKTTGLVDLVVNFIGPVSVIMVLYVRVFVVAVSQARAMRSHVTALTHKPSGNVKTKKSELKAARTLGVVVVVYLMCFCPFYCFSLAVDLALSSPVGAFMSYLFCFNSFLNPLIYALFYPWFRKSIKLIVTGQILKPGSSEDNVR